MMKKYLAFVLVAIIATALKWLYRSMSTADLILFLAPVNKMVSLFFGSQSQYTSDGYYHHAYHIIIDKSCSGFNFFVISFCMLSVLCIDLQDTIVRHFKLIGLCFVACYIIAILANTSRIIASITLSSLSTQNLNFATPYFKEGQLHEAIGVVTYFIFLIGIYSLTQHLISKYKNLSL